MSFQIHTGMSRHASRCETSTLIRWHFPVLSSNLCKVRYSFLPRFSEKRPRNPCFELYLELWKTGATVCVVLFNQCWNHYGPIPSCPPAMTNGHELRHPTWTVTTISPVSWSISKVSWSIFSRCHGQSNLCVKKKVAPHWKTILKFDNSHKILPQCLNWETLVFKFEVFDRVLLLPIHTASPRCIFIADRLVAPLRFLDPRNHKT